MSDLPGLAVGALALGLIAPSLGPAAASTRSDTRVSVSNLLLLGCFLAGLAPGMRLQMAWLTWPATAVAILVTLRRGEPRFSAVAGSFLAGLLAWVVPLGVIAGGPAEYLRVFRLQAAEDLASGQMLALDFSVRGAAQALHESIIAPWGDVWIGGTAVACAALGALRLVRTQPRAMGVLTLCFGPYAVLHLGFQDTTFVRYALPLVPPVAFLAAYGLALFGHRAAIAATLSLSAVSLTVAIRAVVAQSGMPSPPYQALDEVRQRLQTPASAPPVLAMHHAVQLALRGETLPARVLPSPIRYEWLELAKYWQGGSTDPVWFLASRRRTDLALVDPTSRSVLRSYRFPAASGTLMAGARPRTVDWLEIRPPGWVALDGWALTPEIRGVSIRDSLTPGAPRARALVRRRHDAVAIVLGGRNLGGPCATGALVTVSIDGRDVQRFPTRAGESFLKLWRIPPGTFEGPGIFGTLEVRAEDLSQLGQQVDVAFEQFDVQSAGQSVAGLGAGWFEPEYDLRDAVGYRWMSNRAVIRVDAFNRDVVLRLRGEATRRYFTQASMLVVKVGDDVLDTRSVLDDFAIDVPVPAKLLERAGGEITLEASQAFVPDMRSGNGDRRNLGIRIYEVAVRTGQVPTRSAD